MSETDQEGGRIFFSNMGRSMEVEDEIVLTSVGIDIGSSTSHLAFSRIVLERLDTRYMVVERTLLHQSDVLLTPYSGEDSIDADALGKFIDEQYKAVGLKPEEIDTGALILTGVAVRRSNARAIGEIFSEQTGKFVVVSAGDALETTLAAFGSGAVALSRLNRNRVLNIDIGGGTSKIAMCNDGAIEHISAIDIGARVIAYDDNRIITRVEEAGRHFGRIAGVNIAIGETLSKQDAETITEHMADGIMAAIRGGDMPKETADLHRLPAFPDVPVPEIITVSGGVSEFFYGSETNQFGDLGFELAQALRKRLDNWSPKIEQPEQGIRATVVGASQYTVQVSGSTIFIEPLDILPIRNIPVIKPNLTLDEVIDADAVAQSVRDALNRLELGDGERSVAVCYIWDGSATYGRLDAFCRGIIKGMDAVLKNGHPLVLVGDNDVGGLIGMHCRQEADIKSVISIDGIGLDEFDFIDIGNILETSGAVPVVIKSLVFPSQGLGQSGANEPAAN